MREYKSAPHPALARMSGIGALLAEARCLLVSPRPAGLLPLVASSSRVPHADYTTGVK